MPLKQLDESIPTGKRKKIALEVEFPSYTSGLMLTSSVSISQPSLSRLKELDFFLSLPEKNIFLVEQIHKFLKNTITIRNNIKNKAKQK